MLYVYCLAPEVRGLAEGLMGLEGERVEELHCSGLTAFVSRFAGQGAGVKRENVESHEHVVRSIFEMTSVLPFRFGTISTEERILAYLENKASQLKATLERVRGCVEMSVKVIWRPESMRDAPSEATSESGALGEGSAFLLAKRREIIGADTLVRAANDLSKWLNTSLKSVVQAECVAIRPDAKLVISASYLVKHDDVEDYETALRNAIAEHQELRFLSSGPWAPYSFVNINLEFKT